MQLVAIAELVTDELNLITDVENSPKVTAKMLLIAIAIIFVQCR